MGQKEKYDKMLFCLDYAKNRHSYTIEKTHKEGHFAISIENKNEYIYIICPKNSIFRNFSLDIFLFVLIEICVCMCVYIYTHTHTYMDEIRIFIAVLFVIAKAGNILLCLLAQSCLTLCDPKECSPPGSSIHGDSPGKNTGVGCHALFQGIFPTQGRNPGLLHCRWIHYHLSHQGSLEMS